MLIQKIRQLISTKRIAKKMQHTPDYTRQLLKGYKGKDVSHSIDVEVGREVMEEIERFLDSKK